jgi:hypothetical protein
MDLFPITFESCRSGIQWHDLMNPLTGQVYRRRSGPALTAEEKRAIQTAVRSVMRTEMNDDERELVFVDGGLAVLETSDIENETECCWFVIRIRFLSRELATFVFRLMREVNLVAIAESFFSGIRKMYVFDEAALALARWQHVEVVDSAELLFNQLVAFDKLLSES